MTAVRVSVYSMTSRGQSSTVNGVKMAVNRGPHVLAPLTNVRRQELKK